jgi:ADP-ribosyl-[dinitrogen reductase] hydrolase
MAGKKARGIDGQWDRDLTLDLARLRKGYATDVLVSLTEEHELGKLHILSLPGAAAAAGIRLDRFAIPDGGVPADAAQFAKLVNRVMVHVSSGRTVVIHCRGGLGRTGVLAAACLRAAGFEANRAIEIVRYARPGTIENAAQEDFVRNVPLLDVPPLSGPKAALASTPPLSRVRGCLLGGAPGDSLGEPVEFVGSAQQITDRFGNGAPIKLGYAHLPLITDDTQMTLFAAEGIIRAGEARGEDDGDALTRSVQGAFLRWLSTQNGVGEEALAIALLCAATCEGSAPEAVAEALWRSVAHAGDSDSTGSMVGNLLGAMHGVESLPAQWVRELEYP